MHTAVSASQERLVKSFADAAGDVNAFDNDGMALFEAEADVNSCWTQPKYSARRGFLIGNSTL